MTNQREDSRTTRSKVFNLPNQLTCLRLILSLVLFCAIGWGLYLTSFVLFVIAAGTDWLDGYFARKYGMVTTLGRILDPFADKVIICGTFIFLLAVPEMADVALGLRAWMVVVIVGRELLVTALRGSIEGQGTDFSAKMIGKVKMLLQCIAAGACLLYLRSIQPGSSETLADLLRWAVVASVWSAVLLTAYSGVVYVVAAAKLLRR